MLKEKKIFVTPKGLYKCTNKGCMKEYDPNDESALSEEACNFHPGNPIFHDLKKYWTCCTVYNKS
jgi:disease resistance protein